MTTAEIMAKLAKLRKDVDAILGALDKEPMKGAINWGDLACSRVSYCMGDDGDYYYSVDIEEADSRELEMAVMHALHRHYCWTDTVEVRTEW